MSRSYVKVRFNKTDKKTYTYVTDGAVEELSQFTHAVVESPYGTCVVEVVGYDTLDVSTYTGEYKEVVTLFNKNKYNETLERSARKQAIEKELRRRVAKKKLEENFAALLVGDEEGLKLLEEFKSL